MSESSAPAVNCERYHAQLPVDDVQAAVEFYTQKLGFESDFTSGEPPTFAGISLGEVQMFLQKGTPNPKGCSLYFVVDNADELYDFHKASGVEILTSPGDRPHGLRDYAVRDLHGYVLQFGQYIYSVGPSLEIERVDVPVRLERRLAAVLADLADYKRMTVNSCLEETLLHALVGVGPHTKTELAHIEKLKAKHGMDYDSHASYRFVER